MLYQKRQPVIIYNVQLPASSCRRCQLAPETHRDRDAVFQALGIAVGAPPSD